MSLNGFGIYFERQFPADLAAFVEAMPASQRKHFNKSPESYSISMNYLVETALALHVIPLERRPLYAVALYFTSLMDQAMFVHRKDCYERYRRLTDYPKLTGACPGACMYIAEPSMALERTNLFDADPSDYIQSHVGRLEQNRLKLAPIVNEGTAYFRMAFPDFLRRQLPVIADPEALYRQVFNDWEEAQANRGLQAVPNVPHSAFHIAAGWGPVVEVRPESQLASLATLSLQDEFGARLELDFEAIKGSFAGMRLQRYFKVGQSERPKGLPKAAGFPRLIHQGSSATIFTVGPLVCSKRMTAVNQGDLYMDWSGGRPHELASSFPLVGHGVLHCYYSKTELTGLCLERIPITVLNEMPHFKSEGR